MTSDYENIRKIIDQLLLIEATEFDTSSYSLTGKMSLDKWGVYTSPNFQRSAGEKGVKHTQKTMNKALKLVNDGIFKNDGSWQGDFNTCLDLLEKHFPRKFKAVINSLAELDIKFGDITWKESALQLAYTYHRGAMGPLNLHISVKIVGTNPNGKEVQYLYITNPNPEGSIRKFRYDGGPKTPMSKLFGS